ncbi:MAG: ABC transporter permease subunit [Planctomycetia bacterium]|nr:ABC transporter permease subunit [Planctomycetia bacterium]
MLKRWFLLLGCLALAPLPALRADGLDDVFQRRRLIWGGDQEGGGPYIFPRKDDPERFTGYEVDLMDLLCGAFLRAQFQQGQWDNLPELLHRGDIDVVVNGYELTPDRLQKMIATMPYYIYELQLLARRDRADLKSWDGLKPKNGRKPKVGVLNGSAAEKYLKEHYADRVEIVGFDGNTQAMQKTVDGELDATLPDLPIAIFFLRSEKRYPELQFVGSPVGRGYYVMYLRPGDERLRDALNDGLQTLIDNGDLRELYERYGLWNDTQKELGKRGLGTEVTADATARTGWEIVRENLEILLQSAVVTVVLSVVSMPLAIVVGLLVALGRLYGPAPVRWALTGYVEVLRGTPLLLQLLAIYFVLPAIGIRIPAFYAAILGLAVNYSAYEAEIYRAGLLAIPIGQMEAALALGMSKAAALRRVIVPQAVRLVIPPVTNDFIALFKDTSVCSVITVVELTKRYSILANSTGAFVELAAATAVLYLLMSYPLSLLARRLERRNPQVAM